MRSICTICARGGSTGVKNKNIRELCGKPLIAHTILQAKASQLFDKIVVSSDSQAILDVALQWGVDYVIKRPTEMATATAAKLPVMQHALLEAEKHFGVEYDVIVDLDATSPLRIVSDITSSYKMLLENKAAGNLVTGCVSRKSPYFNMLELNKLGFAQLVKPLEQAVVRRQDSPVCYDMNASIYIWRRDDFFNQAVINDKTILFEMPEERSIDIDTPLDWRFVEFLMCDRKNLV